MKKSGKIEYSSDFLKNLATGAGYDSNSNSAVAELLDNSIGAKADVIKITLSNGHFTIEDRGEDAGMDEKTLKKNFFYGGNSSTKKNEFAAGKFGVGGKTGIMSIIGDMDTDVEITTHKRGSKPIWANWQVKRGRSDTYDYEFLDDDTISYGTTIDFDCSKPIDVEELRNFISVTYCWEIERGVKIYVNDKLVTPNDPLYRNNKNVIEKGLYSSKTFKLFGMELQVNSTLFNKGNIIPEDELHSWDCGGRKKKSVLTANRSGIYLRTGGRYYTVGNNFDKLMGGTAHASLDGLRIELCIPKALWDIVGIMWNKGREITPFTKIDIFNTGNTDTGVTDYIHSKMINFKNGKETNAEKSANKISKIINDFVMSHNIDAIRVEVIASNTKEGDFIKYKDNLLTFDISQCSMGQKELVSVFSTIVNMLDTIIKTGNENVIENIIANLNVE